MFASREGFLEIVALLIRMGANIQCTVRRKRNNTKKEWTNKGVKWKKEREREINGFLLIF
jgi:hypothetical protein